MNYQQPSEMQNNVEMAQHTATAQTTPLEQNVSDDQAGQNVYVIPVVQQQQQQQQPYMAGQQSAAHSQAQDMSSGTRSARPTADQNAFMGTDDEGRRGSYHDMTPGQRAKQLAAEMKQKYKDRKKQNIRAPVKQVAIGGKAIDLQDNQ